MSLPQAAQSQQLAASSAALAAAAAGGANYRSANEARRQRAALQNAEQQVQLFHKQRHDMLVLHVAQRAPILRDENDVREQAFAAFKRSLTEIHNWIQRRDKQQARSDARHAKLSENVARVVHMTLDSIDATLEFDARRQLEVMEEKCRRMVWRVMEHDAYLLNCTMQQRRLVRAEARKRETFEAEELRLREEYEVGYNLKPWQPHSLLYGVCPFARKCDCPFSKEKKQRLLPFPVAPDHFAFSS
jgi:hypothetical protein